MGCLFTICKKKTSSARELHNLQNNLGDSNKEYSEGKKSSSTDKK